MSEEKNASIVEIESLVKSYFRPEIVQAEDPNTGEEAPVLILPTRNEDGSAGLEAHSMKKFVDEYRTEPERRKGIAVLGDLKSFIDHANRFKDSGSAIFAQPDSSAPSLTCVLNYHYPHTDNDDQPRFGDHKGLYRFPLSDEWKRWTEQNAKPMSQLQFAEFIENNITDVADPANAGETANALAKSIGCVFASPSKLLELSQGLTVRVDSSLKTALKLATGEATMQFVSAHQDETGAVLKIPGAFLIEIPVFRNDAPYQAAARLRYRVRDEKVTWFFELYRADRIFDHAFKEAAATAAAGTELPLFIGSPE